MSQSGLFKHIRAEGKHLLSCCHKKWKKWIMNTNLLLVNVENRTKACRGLATGYLPVWCWLRGTLKPVMHHSACGPAAWNTHKGHEPIITTLDIKRVIQKNQINITPSTTSVWNYQETFHTSLNYWHISLNGLVLIHAQRNRWRTVQITFYVVEKKINQSPPWCC